MSKNAKHNSTSQNKGDTSMIPVKALTNKPYFDQAIVQTLKDVATAKGYRSTKWATMKGWNSINKSIAKDEQGTLVITYDVQEQRTEDGIEEVRVPRNTYLFNECQLKGYQR